MFSTRSSWTKPGSFWLQQLKKSLASLPHQTDLLLSGGSWSILDCLRMQVEQFTTFWTSATSIMSPQWFRTRGILSLGVQFMLFVSRKESTRHAYLRKWRLYHLPSSFTCPVISFHSLGLAVGIENMGGCVSLFLGLCPHSIKVHLETLTSRFLSFHISDQREISEWSYRSFSANLEILLHVEISPLFLTVS